MKNQKKLIDSKNIIDRFILEEAVKHANRHQAYHNFLHLEHERNEKRYIIAKPKDVKIPDYWNLDNKYNPFYVIKHHRQISRSVSKKLFEGKYKPNLPYKKHIEKKGGGERIVNVYQIPDAAVSNYLYFKLLSKNKHRFSYSAYAYRNDKNVHYAIQDISLEIKSRSRLFVAEYDFSDFFGSISHDYLFEQMDRNGFIITHHERAVLKAFLEPYEKGIPQGTSISLFLANLVCWELDKQLELEGLRFARYADDTIIWSDDYTKICNAYKIISNFSRNSKVYINYKKSNGISMLSVDATQSEFKNTKPFVEFLGYQLSPINVSIKEKSTIRIKNNISYILHKNLIQPLKNNLINANSESLPTKNRDPAFLVAISQIRRYLYGDLNDDKINKYLSNTYKRLTFKGLMSYYPLIDNEKQLKKLDGWLVNTILHYLKKRYDILKLAKKQTPIPIIKKDFLNYCNNASGGLLKIPSFMLIYKAIQKGISSFGIDSIIDPKKNDYNYED